MFKSIDGGTGAPAVQIDVDGKTVLARQGQTVALALLEAGFHTLRHTPVSGQPRSAFCLMGVCFDCLVQVDARPNVQSCMVMVKDGMRIRLQHGARSLDPAA